MSVKAGKARMKSHLLSLAVGIVLVAGQAAQGAIVINQVDDFQGGTTLSWTEGLPSPNPPTNIASGGPGGAGDAYLSNIASGPFGPGSSPVTFNMSQWAGDYLTAGVTGINMQLANFGPNPLSMRLALEGPGGQYGSTVAFVLPADGQWYSASFGLGASDMSFFAGWADH